MKYIYLFVKIMHLIKYVLLLKHIHYPKILFFCKLHQKIKNNI